MAEARARWRAWLGVALLIGALFGSAIAVAAGARRTGSVVARARASERVADIFMVPAYSENGELLDFASIARFPEVIEAISVPWTEGSVDGAPVDVTALSPGQRDGSRFKVVAGSAPSGRQQVAVNFVARDAFGWDPGTTITVGLPAADGSTDSGAESEVAATFEVSAVVAGVFDLSADAAPALYVDESYWRAHRGEIGAVDLFMFRLRRGAESYDAFDAGITQMTGGSPVIYVETSSLVGQARRSFQMLAAGLFILAAFLALTAVLIGSQVLLRLTAVESADHTVLRALGISRPGLFALGIARLAVIAVAAASVATAIAVIVSPLFPFGRPRLVEPAPGVALDPLIVGVGALAVVTGMILVCAVPVWRSTKATGAAESRSGPWFLAGALARIMPGSTAPIGVHLALEPGGVRTAVPVRSSLASGALGVAALVIALTVGASLDHLLSTPRLYGWNWDATVTGRGDIDTAPLREMPEIAAFSTGVTGDGGTVVLAGRQVAATAIEPAGGVAPPVIDGRLPTTDEEIALGVRTLRHAGVDVGDTVVTRFSGADTKARFEVVGTVVLPFTTDTTSLGEGVFLTTDGATRLYPGVPKDAAFIRFAAGTDREATIARLRQAFPEGEVSEATRPSTVVDFGRVTALPIIAAGIVAVLAAAAVGHMLLSSIRNRRRDLAILKAIGARRRQLRAAVAWQSTIITVGMLAIGIPVGAIAGRWLWISFAQAYGFTPRAASPVGALIIVAAGALVLANAVALIPARNAASIAPALVIRDN